MTRKLSTACLATPAAQPVEKLAVVTLGVSKRVVPGRVRQLSNFACGQSATRVPWPTVSR